MSRSSFVHLVTAHLDALLMVLHHLEDAGMTFSIWDNISDLHVEVLTFPLEQSSVLPLEQAHKLPSKSALLLIKLTGLMDLAIIAIMEEAHSFNVTQVEMELFHAQLEHHAIVHQESSVQIME